MRALFIGLGGIGQRHLRILKKLHPDVEIAAVRKIGRSFEIGDDLNLDRSVDIVDKYNIRTYSSVSGALSFAPDFAVLANPTSMHLAAARKLVENKIPILMEKPVSNTDEGLDELLELSDRNSTLIMVGYMMRFHPCAVQLKKYLENNVLGDIYSVVVTVNSYMPQWHKYEGYNEFYAGKQDLGGGVVLTEIHEIDLLYWFFGTPQKIGAVGGTLSKLDLDVEDTVSILMEQKIEKRRFPVNVNMSFVQKAPIRNFLVLGERGSLEWDIANNKLRLDDYEDALHSENNFPKFERNDMFQEQMKYFLDCVRTGKPSFTSLENVVGGHRVALVIKDALKAESFIKL
ncbi:Gfo/Idh/MocA family oxidoreductase [Candidatus Woesearchaeota archaeon]|nr:Gfo/Idh/MocA family oxidoreductase [Candidatus Neomarinimicrobiota bacterium]MBT4731997.1 Gfo/Idh/MocA family oxidoreductase [Candidatus Woesearchaeota archaeon]